jgi:cyanophycin synthetase
VHLHDIRHGLRTFTTSFFQAPGRMNLSELGGVRVLVDYAHNPAGLRAIGEFVERMTAGARDPAPPGFASWSANLRVGVIGTAGDRRDEDIRELGRVAARYFDEIIVREDVRTRGRERGETGALVLEGVRDAQDNGARVGSAQVITDELAAVRHALDRSRPGDLVVLCVDHPAPVMDELESRRAAAVGQS